MEDTARLVLFTIVWTAVWVAPMPRLGAAAELVAGLIPFVAFGLRVFAGFFGGVPADDPIRMTVSPLLDWIDGRTGFPPFAWALDATVALGLVWLSATFDIPRRFRFATAWIMPAVAALSWWSLWATGLPIERLLAVRVPAPLLGLAAGTVIGGGIRWTPSAIPVAIRRRAALVASGTVPLAMATGLVGLGLLGSLPAEHVSQATSIAALAAGAAAAVAALTLGGFERSRSRWLFAMAVGVASGAVLAMVGPRA